MPAVEPDRAATNVLQYSTAEKLFLIAWSEKATTVPILVIGNYWYPLLNKEAALILYELGSVLIYTD